MYAFAFGWGGSCRWANAKSWKFSNFSENFQEILKNPRKFAKFLKNSRKISKLWTFLIEISFFACLMPRIVFIQRGTQGKNKFLKNFLKIFSKCQKNHFPVAFLGVNYRNFITEGLKLVCQPLKIVFQSILRGRLSSFLACKSETRLTAFENHLLVTFWGFTLKFSFSLGLLAHFWGSTSKFSLLSLWSLTVSPLKSFLSEFWGLTAKFSRPKFWNSSRTLSKLLSRAFLGFSCPICLPVGLKLDC